MLPPVKAQPPHVLLDGVHVLHIFPGGIGVVESKVADAPLVLGGNTKLRQIDLACPMCR